MTWEETYNYYSTCSYDELLKIAYNESTWVLGYLNKITDKETAKQYLFSFMASFALIDDFTARPNEFKFINEVWRRLFNQTFTFDGFKEYCQNMMRNVFVTKCVMVFKEHFKADKDFMIAVSNLALAIGAVDGDLSRTEINMAKFVEGQINFIR